MANTNTDMDSLRAAAQQAVRDLRTRISGLGPDEIEMILSGARSHYAWTDRPVTHEQLKVIYDITRMGPTSMNCCPARFIFVTTKDGKARLVKALARANVDKVLSAPVTVIIAHDLEFWNRLPELFPYDDRRAAFSGNAEHAKTTAFRNATLQGAYFIIAARAVGLDVGAMSGFSNAAVDAEFFAGTTLRSNFLCNLGYADESAIFQRLPRLDFESACSFE
ncbi:MAG: malonic semialdehyde reductase [Paracoccaceae bacterium]|nr:malonic semialdehyde reductase [Paracoccaceae bacterium]MDE2914004.1 malonic semialdehyde reductase [Paracoccaceae bacterium]